MDQATLKILESTMSLWLEVYGSYVSNMTIILENGNKYNVVDSKLILVRLGE